MRLELSLSSSSAVELLKLTARDLAVSDVDTGAALEHSACVALNELLSAAVIALDIQQPHARRALAAQVEVYPT